MQCSKCNQNMSDATNLCPHCFAVREKRSTSTIEKQIKIETGAELAANNADYWTTILGFIGFIFLFIFLPIGITILAFSGFISLFGNKKLMSNTFKKEKILVPVLSGNCPSCATPLDMRIEFDNSLCPRCNKPFFVKDSRFHEV